MSMIIKAVAVTSQTYLFLQCCNLFFEKRDTRLCVRLLVIGATTALHLGTTTFQFSLSLLLSMLVDYAMITVLYISNWKTKHILFFSMYLADFILETLAITGLLRINPALQITEITQDPIVAPVITLSIQVTEFILVFAFCSVMKRRKEKGDMQWVGVTLVTGVSILVMWFVFPAFWRIEDKNVNQILLILAPLIFLNSIYAIHSYMVNRLISIREQRIHTAYQLERDKVNRLIEMARANHNLTANYQYIRSAIVNGERDKAVQYLDKVLDSIDGYHPDHAITENTDIDFVLQGYAGRAQDNKIALSMRCMLPVELSFDLVDIVVLLGNVFDNAEKAVCRLDMDRTIDLRIAYQFNRLSIVSQNPITECGPVLEAVAKERAGLGMDIMRSIVKKYAGGLDVNVSDGFFTISLLLQQPLEI